LSGRNGEEKSYEEEGKKDGMCCESKTNGFVTGLEYTALAV
jgi:hypothetical protein